MNKPKYIVAVSFALCVAFDGCNQESNPSSHRNEEIKELRTGFRESGFDPDLVKRSYWEQQGYLGDFDDWPERNSERKGVFTAEALRSLQEWIPGQEVPDWMEPLFGVCKIQKYTSSDTKDFNLSARSYFQIDPAKVPDLEDRLIKAFKSEWNVSVEPKVTNAVGGVGEEIDFPKGSIFFRAVKREERVRHTKVFLVFMNSGNGLVGFKVFQGDPGSD